MYAVLGKTKLRIILFAFLLVVAFVAESLFIGDIGEGNGTLDKSRVSFLNKIGVEVKDVPPEAENIVIPTKFNDVYSAYNTIQMQAGYDLSRYKGKTAVKYSYSVTNYSSTDAVTANILVYNGKIIGGDISSAALGGFMFPLKKITGNETEK